MDIRYIKSLIKPTSVVQRYLGQPIKRNNLGLWYKSPFRNERTESFLVNDEKGIHDFGTSKHYDVISFTQELFKIDFKTAINKLAGDFGIEPQKPISKELEQYMLTRRKEEIELNRRINSWFYQTYGALCDSLKENHKLESYLNGEALSKIYKNSSDLEIWIEYFIDATEDGKYELYKRRKEIQKYLK